MYGDFPGGAVDKNPPANAGDRGFDPWAGKILHAESNSAPVPQVLSPCSRVHELQLLKPTHLEPEPYNKRSHCKEKPVHPTKGRPPPFTATRESLCTATKTQGSQT